MDRRFVFVILVCYYTGIKNAYLRTSKSLFFGFDIRMIEGDACGLNDRRMHKLN